MPPPPHCGPLKLAALHPLPGASPESLARGRQEDFVLVPRMPPGSLELAPRTDPDYDANDPGLLLDIDSDYLTVPSS